MSEFKKSHSPSQFIFNSDTRLLTLQFIHSATHLLITSFLFQITLTELQQLQQLLRVIHLHINSLANESSKSLIYRLTNSQTQPTNRKKNSFTNSLTHSSTSYVTNMALGLGACFSAILNFLEKNHSPTYGIFLKKDYILKISQQKIVLETF